MIIGMSSPGLLIKGLMQILEDEKTSNEIPTLYVSSKDKQGVKYFQDLENELGNFKVGVLPEDYSDEYIETLNTKPGILALHLSKTIQFARCSFVVPGGRFNEMYGWDSFYRCRTDYR
jgi:alpha,alpha-trehalase